MIARTSDAVAQIPIDRIRIVNPRSRGKVKFKEIVTNISKVGLKKPITVVERGTSDGKPTYDLVCGQGRLEALRALGDTTVPAFVVEVPKDGLLLMSLAENLARRRHDSVELLQEIASLKERDYSHSEISTKTGLSVEYVRGVLRLLKSGERALLHAVERRQIPVHIAVTIATADDEEVQRALADAYEKNDLRGKHLLLARRLIEKRRGKRKPAHERQAEAKQVTVANLMSVFRRETTKQRALVQKAKLCETRLLFIVSAFKQLLADTTFAAVLRATNMAKMPQHLAEQIGPTKP